MNGTQSLVATTSATAPVPGAAASAAYASGWAFSAYSPTYSFGSSGFPSGRIGFYTNIAGVKFSAFSSYEDAPVHLAGRWINDSHFTANAAAGNGLTLPAGNITNYRLLLLENLRLQKFQATFALTRASGQSRSWMGLIFDAVDRGNYDYLFLAHDGTLNNPVGYTVAANGAPAAVSGTNPANIPTCANSDTLWLRVQNDGTTVTVKAVNAATAPSESTWTSTTACYSSTAFSNVGGLIGINCSQGSGYVNNFTLKSWDTATSAFDISEHWDNFALDGSGYADETPTYDPNGNLTYDGVQQYTYDAWNRLVGIAHAYRDSGGTLQHGQTFDAMRYDAKGRRLSKAVSNTGQWD